MLTSPFIAVASLLLSFFPLPEKVEYSIAEISIARRATLSYSIGQLEVHKPGGAVETIQLMKTSDEGKVMMVSQPFNVSSGDSIYFRRTLSITGTGTSKVVEKNYSRETFERSYGKFEASQQKQGVKLPENIFNKESHVRFIADILYEGENDVIASLDTITAQRNENGYIKAFTAPLKPEAIKMPLANIDPSKRVVVRVWMHMLLPEATKISVKTKAQLRNKKSYNTIVVNSNTVVPGYVRKN